MVQIWRCVADRLSDCAASGVAQALAIKDGGDFQHILRILGTNVDGKTKVMYAMCSVKGIGRRFSNIVCKKADVDMDKRAGELTQKEMDDLVNVVQNPNEYKIPSWMLNRRKDFKVCHQPPPSPRRRVPFLDVPCGVSVVARADAELVKTHGMCGCRSVGERWE